jgi:hypothetical protein
MASMPGAVVIPAKYGEAMVLYSAVNKVEAVVDGAPAGKNGRLFIVEPGKPVKVPYEAGRFILEHMAYLGVVRVRETETDTGVTYDVDGARKESEDLTASMDEALFQRYVDDVVSDYLNKKKPVPKTSPNIQRIIDRRGFDLKKYGIFVIGQKEEEAQAKMAAMQDEMKALKDQLAALTEKRKGKD